MSSSPQESCVYDCDRCKAHSDGSAMTLCGLLERTLTYLRANPIVVWVARTKFPSTEKNIGLENLLEAREVNGEEWERFDETKDLR
jgi:hypothetical protein